MQSILAGRLTKRLEAADPFTYRQRRTLDRGLGTRDLQRGVHISELQSLLRTGEYCGAHSLYKLQLTLDCVHTDLDGGARCV